MLLWIHKYTDLGFMSTHQAHCANFLIPFPPGSLGLPCSSLTPQHLSEWWMFADLAAEKLFPLYYLYHYRCHLLCILKYFFCIIRHSFIYYRNIGCGPETEKIMALWKMERQWAFRGEWWRGKECSVNLSHFPCLTLQTFYPNTHLSSTVREVAWHLLSPLIKKGFFFYTPICNLLRTQTPP